MKSFFLVNVMGFVTYHLYPAAPPWYFEMHRCSIDVLARASAGPNLTRVTTRMLGFPFSCTGLYGRSNDVFGAGAVFTVA